MRPAICLVLVLVLATDGWAHHILGIPHYAYDESYPQTPVLTYLFMAGSYEVQMTGYPGVPEPGERCDLHVSIKRKGHTADPLASGFEGRVRLTIMEDSLIGEDAVIYGPVDAERDQGLYKFHPSFPREANYLTRIEFEVEGAPWIVDLPMVVGQPGSPWTVLGGSVAALVLFVLVIRAMRIKLARKARAGVLARSRP